jgi:hypothetical protein
MLLDDIQKIINQTIPFVKSENGLHFQFRPAGVDDPFNRIIVYRVEGRPTVKELAAVRRNLEALLPKDTLVEARNGFTYDGSDDKPRYCFPFAWLPKVQQSTLLPSQATSNYLEV